MGADAGTGADWLRSRRTAAGMAAASAARAAVGHREIRVAPGFFFGRPSGEGRGTVERAVPEGAHFDYEQARGYRASNVVTAFHPSDNNRIPATAVTDQLERADHDAALPAPDELEDWDLSPIRARRHHYTPSDNRDGLWQVLRELPYSDATIELEAPPDRPRPALTGGLPYVAPAVLAEPGVLRRPRPGWLPPAGEDAPQWAKDQLAELTFDPATGTYRHHGPDNGHFAPARTWDRVPPEPPEPSVSPDVALPEPERVPAPPPPPRAVVTDERGAITPEAWAAYWTA